MTEAINWEQIAGPYPGSWLYRLRTQTGWLLLCYAQGGEIPPSMVYRRTSRLAPSFPAGAG